VSIITLTTDFGTADWFVGTMKGVIAGLAPQAVVIDLTHDVPPGDIRAGAFALAAGYRFFPEATVHVAVVDPGVGSARKAIAVQTPHCFFLGPDNGLLSWALAGEKIKTVRTLENAAYFLPRVGRTFHGRDIFAPVAAHLSNGTRIQRLGPRIESWVRLDWPPVRQTPRGLEGEVIYIDRFGNAITNIDVDALQIPGDATLEVFLGRRRLCSLAAFYQAVPRGRAVAVIGSSGFVEIAVSSGSAAGRLGLRVGTAVRMTRRRGA
jgi:S-adenosyl-L-methionine hydrolase (adenosine-forming)